MPTNNKVAIDQHLPKLLFISRNNLTHSGGAATLFRTIIEKIPREKLSWVIAGGWNRKTPLWMNGRKIYINTSIFFNRYVIWFLKKTPLYHFTCWYKYRYFPSRILKRIINFAEAEKIDKIWVHAMEQTIPLANRLAKKLDLPLHVSIQDDIEAHTNTKEADWFRDDFSQLLSSCATCDVTSVSMKNYYINKYNACKDAYIYWNGGVLGDLPPIPGIQKNITIIGYAGNLWSKESLKILIDAIEILNNERDNKNLIKLYLYSQRLPNFFSIKNSIVEYKGFFDHLDLLKELQHCDLLYVPLPFSPRYEILCKTSLPGKILTYMKSQIPLLAHGPEYASNVNFVINNMIGIASCSESPLKLAQQIKQYGIDFEERVKASRQCRYLSIKEYNPHRIWQDFKKVLFKTKKSISYNVST